MALVLHRVRDDWASSARQGGDSVELARWADGWAVVRVLDRPGDLDDNEIPRRPIDSRKIIFRMVDLTRAASLSKLTETILTFYSWSPTNEGFDVKRSKFSSKRWKGKDPYPTELSIFQRDANRWWWFVEALEPSLLPALERSIVTGSTWPSTPSRRKRLPKMDVGVLSPELSSGLEVYQALGERGPAFWRNDAFSVWYSERVVT